MFDVVLFEHNPSALHTTVGDHYLAADRSQLLLCLLVAGTVLKFMLTHALPAASQPALQAKLELSPSIGLTARYSGRYLPLNPAILSSQLRA
jgi:hypothetical protein